MHLLHFDVGGAYPMANERRCIEELCLFDLYGPIFAREDRMLPHVPCQQSSLPTELRGASDPALHVARAHAAPWPVFRPFFVRSGPTQWGARARAPLLLGAQLLSSCIEVPRFFSKEGRKAGRKTTAAAAVHVTQANSHTTEITSTKDAS